MGPGQLAYFARYGFDTFVLGRRKPIFAGIALTDVCNLRCKHCVVANVGRGHYPLAKIEQPWAKSQLLAKVEAGEPTPQEAAAAGHKVGQRKKKAANPKEPEVDAAGHGLVSRMLMTIFGTTKHDDEDEDEDG